MSTFVIGDLHGCLDALKTMVKFANITENDTLITLGDVVDRGPSSAAIIDWLIARHQVAPTVSLLGNHEIMMMRSRFSPSEFNDWLLYGGRETLASYGTEIITIIPTKHWDFLDHTCVDYHELTHHFCVHAAVNPLLSLPQQPEIILFWEKLQIPPKPHQNGKIMICGHTAQKNGLPYLTPTTICLDTWCYGGGWLTALQLETGQLYQTRESGETRTLAYVAPTHPPNFV
ncbi:MAG: metallophosphoesterase family protein [Sumerlaeia bacterium]